MIFFIKIILIAFVISLILTPAIKIFAIKVGAVDIPNHRKIHKGEVPRLGGLAIFIAFSITSLITFNHVEKNIRGIILGSAVIILCGILDDIKTLNYKSKLLFQSIAVIFLILNGIQIEKLRIFNQTINLGIFSWILTGIWVISITNAINLLDGMDGLACGVSSIISFFLAIISIINGNIPIAIIMFSILGATLGFLPYNFKNAKIFMGDSGALFLGFILATATIQGTIKTTATFMIAPTLLLAIPIYDTINIIIRRKIKGIPITMPDKEHIHHRLLAVGLTQPQVNLIIYSLTFLLGIISILLSNHSKISLFICTIGFLFLILCIIVENVLYFNYKKDNYEKENSYE